MTISAEQRIENEVDAPRLLVVSGFPLDDDSASGHMMRNLLATWPTKSFAYLCAGGPREASGVAVNLRTKPGVYGRFVQAGRQVTASHAQTGAHRGGHRALLRLLKPSLLAYLEMIPFTLDSDTEDWIERFNPQVIYTWLGSPALHRLVGVIARRRRIPTAIHVMDDWVNCKYAGNLLAAPSRWALVRSFERLVSGSAACIAISDVMATVYRERYRRHFDVISNAVDLTRFALSGNAHCKGQAGQKHRFTLAHIGRINGGRGARLVEVVRALEILGARGIEARLELLGITRGELPLALRDSSIVTVDEDDSDEQICALGARVDALLQVESFDSRENRWFELSLSAKLPVYLALGRPIFAYGPGHLGSIAYVQAGECGIVVDRPDIAALLAAFDRLITDSAATEAWGSQGRRLARERHNLSLIGVRFRAIMARAAGQGGT